MLLIHCCRVLTSSQQRYLMYWDFFWIWGCYKNTHCINSLDTISFRPIHASLQFFTTRWQWKIMSTYLQHHAIVCGSLVLALVVLTKVDINMIQLEETRQVSGCLHKHTYLTTLHPNTSDCMTKCCLHYTPWPCPWERSRCLKPSAESSASSRTFCHPPSAIRHPPSQGRTLSCPRNTPDTQKHHFYFRLKLKPSRGALMLHV